MARLPAGVKAIPRPVLAGLVVAIPLLLYGLTLSTLGSPTPAMLASGYLQEGNSLLYIAAKWLVFGRFLPSGGVDVQLSPVAWGAWIVWQQYRRSRSSTT